MDTSRWRSEIARRARVLGRGARDAARNVARPVGGLSRRAARTLRWLLIAAAVLFLAIVALDVLIDEPLRWSIERRMNAALEGYTVGIGGCDLSPWNVSLDLTDLLVLVRELRLADGELGFVNRAREPGYRVFVSGTEATVTGWSNHPDAEGSRFQARGAFIGSGRTAVRGFFRPDEDGADFELAVAIEGTRLESMNDLLESYANLDVVDGTFSFYTEMRVANGRIDGYVKPLFHEVNVYEPEQDRDEGFFHRLWERIAEGLGQILENPPREDVATVADISGELSDPDTSNLQVVLRLIENAFFDAILPGFRDEAEGN